MLRFWLASIGCAWALTATLAQEAKQNLTPDNEFRPIEDVAGLPRVLIIGDSISIGYTPITRTLLSGQVNVHRIPTNGSSTGFGLANLDKWLGTKKWDVIHFNFGLHDAKLPPEGVRHAPLDIYEKNLRELVARMSNSATRLIWATTTPVPKGGQLAANRRFGNIDQYNAAAKRVMLELGVPINDLNTAIVPHLSDVGRSNDVHFSVAGYKILAKYVADAIRQELPQARKAEQRDKESVHWQLNESFYVTPYGQTPSHWYDAIGKRPSRAWIADGNGILRQVLKNATGLLLYRGASDQRQAPIVLSDAAIKIQFKKTEDDSVAISVIGRAQDDRNYYAARFRGRDRLELVEVVDAVEIPLDQVKPAVETPLRPQGMITSDRYSEGELWSLSLDMHGDLITATVRDEHGSEMARVRSRSRTFSAGQFGVSATRFCGIAECTVAGQRAHEKLVVPERSTMRQLRLSEHVSYPVIKPRWNVEQTNTRFDLLADAYDLVIAGAGTGGTSAAIQATRLGAKVLLLEETDWIGGQMSSAGVTTMDEDGGYGKSPVRERGIYREFNESMVAYYQTLDKDPFMTYYSYPHQVEGGYEPKVTRAVLYGFIDDRRRQSSVLDVSIRTKVARVIRQGDKITGVEIKFDTERGSRTKLVNCQVLIDATEYGDVIPLTGARYRSGNRTSDALKPAALVQDHTWLAIAREYPQGIPDHLRIKEPPPGYEAIRRRFAGKTDDGAIIWGGQFKGIKGPRHWRTYFAWRGSADTESTLTGERSVERHTQCGFNGGNDYPVTSGTLENLDQRAIDERVGIYKTLATLYFYQHELGVNWSLAEDEGFATVYNRAKMKALGLRPDLETIAVHLPQQPYVRESRRLIGVNTLKASDLTRYEEARHFSNAVAMGDYFMDLDHGRTAHEIEQGLDSGELPRGGGPFQVPMDVFIPESINGFLCAEKNISQSRLANGATRLQPITMLTGQAAGAIAALAINHDVELRQLEPRPIQMALLEAGSTLIQRWHSDVPWGTKIWRATQLLSLYKIIDRPGPLTKDSQWLAASHPWGVDAPLSRKELTQAMNQTAHLCRLDHQVSVDESAAPVSLDFLKTTVAAFGPQWSKHVQQFQPRDTQTISAGEFALLAYEFLK